MLICRDVEASIKFYINVLGFEVINKMDDVGKSGWAALRCGPIDLMLASPTFLPEPVKVDGKYPQSTRKILIHFTSMSNLKLIM